MVTINRKVLKSISELSSFKFLLIFYLVFFIIWVIVIGIIYLIAWLGLSSAGINIGDLLQGYGIGNFGLLKLEEGNILYLIIAVIGGLVASVFYAAIGTLMVWIVNVILRISGGIELRFIEKKDTAKTE
jgi:hypothetical protein